MKIRFFVLLLSAIALAGCQLSGLTAATPPAERWLGHLQQHQQDWQLLPCSGEPALTVEFPERLDAALQLCRDMPDSRCFADLQALTAGERKLQVTDLQRLLVEGHGCDEAGFDRLQFHAFGNEPFWSIQLNDQGLLLQQPGEPAIALPYIIERTADGQAYISSDADHDQLGLWIRPEPCMDSMSGSHYHLGARLEWQGRTLTGCAYQGGLTP